MAQVRVSYSAPPTLSRFLDSDAFVRFCIGPVGSGKSSACIMELLRRAREQAPGPDGVRRTRFAIIRNTYRELQDTTRRTFEQWVPSQLGRWYEQDFTFHIKFGDVDSEVLFRALDRPEHVKKLLSLEVTGAYINEVREVPKNVLDILQTRVGRFPSKIQGGPTWFGIWADTNPWHTGHWGAKLFADPNADYALFRQPGGRAPNAENLENLPPKYYERLIAGKDSEWVKVYIDGEDADGAVGSIFGPWVGRMERDGRVCDFDHPLDGVFTIWDLGHSDSTAIWFWRLNRHGAADLIDHYEAHGEGLSHYLDEVDKKGFTYTRHWLPHDAKAKTLVTQVTVLDQCLKRWPGKVSIVPNLAIADGIAAARWLFEQPTRIHSRCGKGNGKLDYSGLDALKEYRFEWDETAKAFSRDPLHNWASHTGDATRYLGLVVKHAGLMSRQSEPVGPPNIPSFDRSTTLDQLWDDRDSQHKRDW